jgi:uncharacterized repeat protein (TIGR01451 family)
MKFSMIRLLLSLSLSLMLLLGLFGWVLKAPIVAAYSPPSAGEAIPEAFVHLWDVNELFSCGDGSEQFVELRNPGPLDDFETNFNGQTLVATNLAGTLSHTYTFTGNVSSPTGDKYLLIATDGFSSLPGGVIPDFTLPDNFLFSEGGTVKFGSPAPFDTVTYGAGQLPLDGVNSLNRQGPTTLITATNSPVNFAGVSGSVSCPATPSPNLTLTKIADAAGIVEAGSVLSYTITVVNSGNVAATSALITDTVPLSTTYVPNSASDGGIFGSSVISWPNLTINQGATLTRTFQVTVSATVTNGDKITNTAHITAAEGVSDTGSVVVTVGELANRRLYLPIIVKGN